MKFSTRIRYGTRFMINLAKHYGQGALFLRDIANAEDISEKYLSQIVIALRCAGLINSFRGMNGGYILAKPPAEITLKDIVITLEGNANFTNCIDQPELCQKNSKCNAQNLWKEVGEKFYGILENISLESLVDQDNKQKQDLVMYNI